MQSDELSEFLENTKKALKKHTVKELNAALNSVLKGSRSDVSSEDINKVLFIVAEQYSTSVRILKRSTARGKIQIARNMAYCLLHYELSLPTRYIANRIFDRWQNCVSTGIKYFKGLNPKNKDDKEFLDTYTQLQLKIKPIKSR